MASKKPEDITVATTFNMNIKVEPGKIAEAFVAFGETLKEYQESYDAASVQVDSIRVVYHEECEHLMVFCTMYESMEIPDLMPPHLTKEDEN